MLWVVARSSALHTDDMSGTTVTTFVAGAVGFIGREAATFEINCFKYCGRGPGRMKASSIVTPRA